MSRRTFVPATLLAMLVALAPLALGQDTVAPPADASVVEGTQVAFAHWVGSGDAVNGSFDSGATATLWLAASALAPRLNDTGTEEPTNATDENATEPPSPAAAAAWFAVVNLTADGLTFTPATVTLAVPENETEWALDNVTISAIGAATGATGYAFTVTLHEGAPDGPVVETFDGTGSVTVQQVIVPPPPPGVSSTPLLVGLVAVLVVGAGGAALAVRQRRERARMERAPRRSQALREQQLETRMQRAQQKERAEEVQEIQQEIRQQEKVREVRRELQILEAKRADAMKTLDLLRKRHEAGGLSKFQYDAMVAKKQADLERIEREIAEMNGGGAAA